MIFIYKLTNRLNGKPYVGQTKFDVPTRLAQHAKTDSVIGRAIRADGLENFDVELLAVVNELLADSVESEMIQRYNSLVPNGYNVAKGGYPPRR